MRTRSNAHGNVLSLMALAKRTTGAASFYGDANITPALSVLSSVERLTTVPGLGATVDLSGSNGSMMSHSLSAIHTAAPSYILRFRRLPESRKGRQLNTIYKSTP